MLSQKFMIFLKGRQILVEYLNHPLTSVYVSEVGKDYFITNSKNDTRGRNIIYYDEVKSLKLDYNWNSLIRKNVELSIFNEQQVKEVISGVVESVDDEAVTVNHTSKLGTGKYLKSRILEVYNTNISVPEGGLFGKNEYTLYTDHDDAVSVKVIQKRNLFGFSNTILLEMSPQDFSKLTGGPTPLTQCDAVPVPLVATPTVAVPECHLGKYVCLELSNYFNNDVSKYYGILGIDLKGELNLDGKTTIQKEMIKNVRAIPLLEKFVDMYVTIGLNGKGYKGVVRRNTGPIRKIFEQPILYNFFSIVHNNAISVIDIMPNDNISDITLVNSDPSEFTKYIGKIVKLTGLYITENDVKVDECEGRLSQIDNIIKLTSFEFNKPVKMTDLNYKRIVKIEILDFKKRDEFISKILNLPLLDSFVPEEYIEELKNSCDPIQSFEKIRDHLSKTLIKTNQYKTAKFTTIFLVNFLEAYLEYAKQKMPQFVDPAMKCLSKVALFINHDFQKWKDISANKMYEISYRQKEKKITILSLYIKDQKEYIVVTDHSDNNKTKTFFTEFVEIK